MSDAAVRNEPGFFDEIFRILREVADSQKETDRQFKETDRQFKETDRKFKETDRQFKETDLKFQETDRQFKETKDLVKELSQNIGGLNNSFGAWGEAQFSYKLWEKFDELGYEFTMGGPKTFKKDGVKLAECDVFLENGEYVCAVEIKTAVTQKKIDEHLARLQIIRGYMDVRGDARRLIGAMAGVVFNKIDQEYAISSGLYVITQSNDNIAITPEESSWKPKEW